MVGEQTAEERTLSEEAVGGGHLRKKELRPMGKDGEMGILKIGEMVKVRARAGEVLVQRHLGASVAFVDPPMWVVIHRLRFVVSSWAEPGVALSRWARVTMAIPHYEIPRLIVTFSCPGKRVIGSSGFPLTTFDLIDSHISQLADH